MARQHGPQLALFALLVFSAPSCAEYGAPAQSAAGRIRVQAPVYVLNAPYDALALGPPLTYETLQLRPSRLHVAPSFMPGQRTRLSGNSPIAWARYANALHERIHVYFAEQFLWSLDDAAAPAELQDRDLRAQVEVQVDGHSGAIKQLGIRARTTAALSLGMAGAEALLRAFPYVPPVETLSADGNAYFHWEFYRDPELACSTYFFHPYHFVNP